MIFCEKKDPQAAGQILFYGKFLRLLSYIVFVKQTPAEMASEEIPEVLFYSVSRNDKSSVVRVVTAC